MSEYQGKTYKDAVLKAQQDLNKPQAELTITVVDPGRRGLLAWAPGRLRLRRWSRKWLNQQRPHCHRHQKRWLRFNKKTPPSKRLNL
ncbi:Jag N-terminal domain-containing protein [Limosilactobacillus fermentum]|nr:Jag N-terminal domain-containing protein [Limosilactobacillus fermentum]